MRLTSARGTTGDSDSFTATVDGVDLTIEDGSVVYAAGTWYCNAAFLEKAVKATVNWDNDENTLVIRVTDRSAAQSAD